MTDKLDNIEADLATTNPDAVTVTIPRKHMEWLIAEVKRLRDVEANYKDWYRRTVDAILDATSKHPMECIHTWDMVNPRKKVCRVCGMFAKVV